MFKKLIVSEAMRRRVSWTIAIILFLPFIIFFSPMSQSMRGGAGDSAGMIFGKRISRETFQEQRTWLERQWENRFGEIPEMLQPMLTQSTWDRLILLEEAKHRHLQIDDQELAAFIQQTPVFQDHNRFVPERYRRFLQAARTTPQTFERLLRKDLLVEKLLTAMKGSIIVSDDDVAAAYRQAHEQLRATVFVFDPASYTARAATAMTEKTLHTFYDAHSDNVRIPAQLTIEYTGATHDELAAHTQPTEEALQAFYQEHEEQFAGKDGKTQPFADVRETAHQQLLEEQVRKQLTALALDLQDDLEAQLRFEEIVKTRALIARTVGPLSTNSSWMPEGPEPAVLQAVETRPIGRLSDVITTSNGVYLARVTQRISSRVPPFEEVRNQVRTQLMTERTKTEAREAAEAYRKQLVEQRAAGWRFEETRLQDHTIAAPPATFTRTAAIDAIGYTAAINEAAFRTPLGELTDVLDSPKGFVILRPEEHIPADLSTFAADAVALRQETLNRKQAEHLESWLQELRSRAKLKDFVSVTPPTSP